MLFLSIRCGKTALHLAMDEEHIEADLCKLLNRSDLDVNVQNEEGNSPLHVLASQSDDGFQGNETFVLHCVICMLLGRRDLPNWRGQPTIVCGGGGAM